MTHLQQARQSLAKCQTLVDEAGSPDYYQAVELAQAHAQIAQAEALARLAEVAETWLEMNTSEPKPKPPISDIRTDPEWQRFGAYLRGETPETEQPE